MKVSENVWTCLSSMAQSSIIKEDSNLIDINGDDEALSIGIECNGPKQIITRDIIHLRKRSLSIQLTTAIIVDVRRPYNHLNSIVGLESTFFDQEHHEIG